MIYTFYSFKGGVGRSMALASVAYLLATRGLRVLTIDFDLEAPGLERYFFEADGAQAAKAKPGLMDLLLTYKKALTNEEEFRKGEFRDWRRFVQSAVPTVAGGGCVEIMTAGRREPPERYGEYATAVRTFDWLDFFNHWKGERFFDWLRSELIGTADAAGAYDTMLVDSRTGITEMGGVCAYQLADVAVMLCAANDQNLDGTLRVARDFRSDATLALRRGRRLEILVIPARLETQNERRQEFLNRFSKTFERSAYLPKQLFELNLDYEQLALPYDPAFAIIEQIVGERASAHGVAAAAVKTFERLADALTLLAWTPGRMQAGQQAARSRILGIDAGAGAGVAQVADPTKVVADFDVFLDESALHGSELPPLERSLREMGLRVASMGVPAAAAGNLAAGLDAMIDASRCVIVVFRSDEVSEWTSNAIDRARARQKTILPLVVGASAEAPAWRALRATSLAHLHAVRLDERDPSAWPAAVFAAWKQLQAGLQEPTHDAESEIEPYPGTRAFGEADAGFFFGRDSEIAALSAVLERADVTVLAGASSIGKTSLVRAGLIPALRAAAETAGRIVRRIWYCDIVDHADPGAGLAAWLRDAASEPGVAILDSVDSFPADGTPEAVQARIELIGSLLDQLPDAVRVLLVMRETLDAALGERVQERWQLVRPRRLIARYALGAMSGEHLAQAIEKPAARVGHVVDPGLTALLINQAGTSPGAIAEVARVLPALWHGRRRGWLTASTLESQGGVHGAFVRAWSAFAAGLTPPECEAANELVHALSRLDNAMRWYSAANAWSVLATIPAIKAVDAVALRDRMAAQHFVQVWLALPPGPGEDAPALRAGEPMLALAHEPPSLFGAAHAAPFDAQFFLWRNQFISYVAAWERANRAPNALLSEQALQEAELQGERHREHLSEPERLLIERSRVRWDEAEEQRAETERELALEKERAQAQRQRLEEKTRQQRRLQILYGVITATLVVLMAVLAWGTRQARMLEEAAKEQAHTAKTQADAAEALKLDADKNAAEAQKQRARADELARQADLQAQVAEEKLKRIIDQFPDAAMRERLRAQHLPGTTPVLTRTQKAQLDAKTAATTAADAAGPRSDQPKGFKLWRNGSTLRVRMMGGSAQQRALVQKAAQEWSKYANVNFEFVQDGDAELRIAFGPNEGSWSFVGTDALGVPKNQPTMNLGFPHLDSVLHEFGHALGLIHENQNPNARLPWDREAVYAQLTSPPNMWDRSTVDRTVLTPERIDGYRTFDPDSIMMYEFPAAYFTDGKARGGSKVLSAGDKAFIAKLYPGR